MYLIYPLLCLLGAEVITSLKTVSELVFRLTLVAVIVLSLSTSVQNVRSYGAPLMVWSQPMSGRVCVGREWYRFPSSFFLSDSASLGYIDDGVTNQLPQPFVTTRSIPLNMNDQNREEKSRYVDISTCDYVIDVNLTSQPMREDLKAWVKDTQIPQKKMLFLDRAETKQPFRSIYIPVLTEGYYKLVYYLALKNPNSTVDAGSK